MSEQTDLWRGIHFWRAASWKWIITNLNPDGSVPDAPPRYARPCWTARGAQNAADRMNREGGYYRYVVLGQMRDHPNWRPAIFRPGLLRQLLRSRQ